VLPLDTAAAERIGAAAGHTGRADVVDVHVALAARDRGAAVITSEDDDILSVDPELEGLLPEV
jgi:hypothetical protein